MSSIFSKIFPVLAEHISPHDTLVLGVSGGPDSTALLDVLARFIKKIPCRIIVAHVNHGIRGKEALADESFVKQRASEYGFICEIKRMKLAGKSGLEERGREARRAFFEKLRKKYKARWILTAHTEDDQLETIIFNFLRGSGPAGLVGMSVAGDYYLKPLLGIPKSEILAYLKRRKLSFCTDSTNSDTQFRRNFIRKKIMPLLSEINPSFRKTLVRNSAIFAQIDRFMRSAASDFLKKHQKGDALFPLKAYGVLPAAVKHEVIQECYRHFVKTAYRLPFVKICEIARLLDRNIGNKKILHGRFGFLLKKGMVYALHF